MGSVRARGRRLCCWGGLVLLGVVLMGGTPAAAQRFLPDDPLWSDPDRMDMPFPEPQPANGTDTGPIAYLQHILTMPEAKKQLAANVNTVGGVPNSSWYTNRHYRSQMARAALQQGPNATPGPARQASWTVVEVQGEAPPRLLVRDTTGRRFRLLFDTEAHPEMATGAAMVSSRLLYALGYNVPHYWLRTIARDRLVPASEASVTEEDLTRVLAGPPRNSDGQLRVLVSRIPNVERRIGPFSFRGRRVDDGNDIFPHEDRRELRGLRLVAAWIHHSMIRDRHTLDVGVRDHDRRFVRHYLTDLHLTLGSAGAEPKRRWAGHEHSFEFDRVMERALTLGLSGSDWTETTSPYWPALGDFTARDFAPSAWRPEWPNAAFQRMTGGDAFWAAKKIRHFTRADLAAAVETADYSSPTTENFVIEALVQRRNAIGRAYLGWGGGLGQFRVEGTRLRFRDLRAQYDYAPDSVERTVTWHAFNNQENKVEERLRRATTRQEAVPIPPSRAAFLRVQFQTPTRGGEVGETRVFLRRTLSRPTFLPPMTMPYEVVGIERRGSVDN